MTFAKRYSDLAYEMAEKETDEKRKAELAKPRAGRKSNKQKKFEELIATGKLTEEEATVLGYKAPKD